MHRSSPTRLHAGPLSSPDRRPTAAARLSHRLLQRVGNPAISIALWTGEVVATCKITPLAQLMIADRKTLMRLFLDPEIEFGEGFSDGRIQVRGDLTRLLEEVNRCEAALPQSAFLRAPLRAARAAMRYSSRSGARDNIHHHYDISNDFYSWWLGKTMAYTCAYYPTATSSLDEAQVAKMDHVCRKLRLRPGERVLEAGCGWGALANHMAAHYGVRVTALNISTEQLSYARRRARSEGVADRIDFVEADYRDLRQAGEQYDAFVSIGMLEHVNPRDYEKLGHDIQHRLNACGRALIHSIGRNRPARVNAWIEKRIFPGAHAPALRDILRVVETADHSVLDVENLRLHYSRTLRDWRSGFLQNVEAVRTRFDERFVRMWELYLCGSEAAFNTGDLQLFQILFAPRASSFAPWTRADIYEQSNVHEQP